MWQWAQDVFLDEITTMRQDNFKEPLECLTLFAAIASSFDGTNQQLSERFWANFNGALKNFLRSLLSGDLEAKPSASLHEQLCLLQAAIDDNPRVEE